MDWKKCFENEDNYYLISASMYKRLKETGMPVNSDENEDMKGILKQLVDLVGVCEKMMKNREADRGRVLLFGVNKTQSVHDEEINGSKLNDERSRCFETDKISSRKRGKEIHSQIPYIQSFHVKGGEQDNSHLWKEKSKATDRAKMHQGDESRKMLHDLDQRNIHDECQNDDEISGESYSIESVQFDIDDIDYDADNEEEEICKQKYPIKTEDIRKVVGKEMQGFRENCIGLECGEVSATNAVQYDVWEWMDKNKNHKEMRGMEPQQLKDLNIEKNRRICDEKQQMNKIQKRKAFTKVKLSNDNYIDIVKEANQITIQKPEQGSSLAHTIHVTMENRKAKSSSIDEKLQRHRKLMHVTRWRSALERTFKAIDNVLIKLENMGKENSLCAVRLCEMQVETIEKLRLSNEVIQLFQIDMKEEKDAEEMYLHL
eukprot:gene9812-10819_t